LSRNYDAYHLRRKLKPAIAELEFHGFLTAVPEGNRFRKMSSGDWRVVFERASGKAETASIPPPPEREALVQALVERGVSGTSAIDIVTKFPPERVQAQLEVFDWLRDRKDARAMRNPPGYLLSSIKGEYAPPKDFVSPAERVRREEQAQARLRREIERADKRAAPEQVRMAAREAATARFLSQLSDEERKLMEIEALSKATAIEKDLIARGGAFAAGTRKRLIEAHAFMLLGQRG
jgi:hypothetical protein